MIISELNGIKITAVAAAVSEHWTSLEEINACEDVQVIQKFIKKTGVKGRYEAGLKQTTSDFCYAAAKKIIEEKEINPQEIGILVFVTQSSDYELPATACLLQDRLGLGKECIAFDVNLGCSGFSNGLNIVSSLLQTTSAKKALLLAGDTSAKEKQKEKITKTTHAAKLLFGDSGTAALLEKTDDSTDTIRMISRTDGAGYKNIIAPYGGWRNPDGIRDTKMDDIGVFNFAIDEVPVLLKATMELTGASPEDYDCLVLHQANLYILKQVAKRSGFGMEKVLISMDEFANTSSASIPVSLVKEYGNTHEGRKLHALMCGFGVGLSWSTVDTYINVEDILPLVHTDEYFEDGYGDEAENTEK